MVRVLIAGLIAMVVSIVIGPKFIEFMRRNELGQPIREDGPAGHVVKQGTPVMGGLLIMLCALPPVFRPLALHAARAHRPLRHRRLRRDRLPRRLHQAPPPPLARPEGSLEAPAPARDHRRRRIRPSGGGARGHVDLPAHRRRRPAALVPLLSVPLPRDRRRGERRQPDGRSRRARGGDGDHLAASPFSRSA